MCVCMRACVHSCVHVYVYVYKPIRACMGLYMILVIIITVGWYQDKLQMVWGWSKANSVVTNYGKHVALEVVCHGKPNS